MASITQTVEELIFERPDWAKPLQEMGIAIHGDSQTLERACQQTGIDPAFVLEQLERHERHTESGLVDYSHMTLGELCDFIVTMHHAHLKEALPRIGLMLYRVTEGDSERHPELNRVMELYSVLAGDLKLHMSKEEEMLFPLIVELETAATFCGDLSTQIEHLETEDAQSCERLSQIRQLTHEFSPPDDACDTYRAVLTALGDLERELREHLGIENNILFPRAWQLEQSQLTETEVI